MIGDKVIALRATLIEFTDGVTRPRKAHKGQVIGTYAGPADENRIFAHIPSDGGEPFQVVLNRDDVREENIMSPWERTRKAACDFFHCADEDLRVEAGPNGTVVYADGGRDFSAVFAADHTDVECEVHYYHVSDEIQISQFPSERGKMMMVDNQQLREMAKVALENWLFDQDTDPDGDIQRGLAYLAGPGDWEGEIISARVTDPEDWDGLGEWAAFLGQDD